MVSVPGGPNQLNGAAIGASVTQISPEFVDKLNARYRDASAAYSDPALRMSERRNVIRWALIVAAILLVIFVVLWFMPY